MQAVSSPRRRFLILVTLVAVLALLAGAFYLGRISAPQKEYAQTSTNEDQALEILQEVGKLIVLPQGEVPQMVAIDNAESAKQAQPFLARRPLGFLAGGFPRQPSPRT